MTEVVTFPKVVFPLFSLDPKAGAQSTKGPMHQLTREGNEL